MGERVRAVITRTVSESLRFAYGPAHRRLVGVRDLRAVQGTLLRRLVRANAETWFGRAHGFGAMGSAADFQRQVPLTTWDGLALAVERIADGEPGVLTAEPVRLLEPSSGSTAATKLIPYTASLLREFQAGLQPWLHDLYTRHPALRRGRSYWSATPAATHPQRATKVPIGFEDDTAYLGPLAGRLMEAVFAVAPDVARAGSMDEFRRRTAVGLLAAADLALVSVWNPTFFTVLLEWMTAHRAELLRELPAGRAREIDGPLAAGDWTAIWPGLAVVSCWADANAAGPARELAALLPQSVLQPKGLLATEALISVPLAAAGGAVLAARGHVVEFLGDDGRCRFADEVEVGGTYEVVVTTGGGLYRYRLGDLVEVTGWHGALPVLRFLGRADKVSDLVGEKLSEAFVAAALASAGIGGFAYLAPSSEPGETPHYVLCLEDSDGASGVADAGGSRVERAPDPCELAAEGKRAKELDDAAARLDEALRASFHYDYARRLGQLGPVATRRLSPGARERFLEAQVARGQRLGDVKPPTLVLDRAPAPRRRA